MIALSALAGVEVGQPPAVFAQSAPAVVDDPVVARVGSTEIRKSYLEKRMAETPRAGLARLGSTPEAIRREFLDKVILPDVLISEDAKARGVDKLGDIRQRLQMVKRSALIQDLRSSSKADAITADEIRAYYQANADRFVSPKRIQISRILLETESDARELIKELGTTPELKKWNDTARDRSLDRSTHLKGGNLGLVGDDGSTAEQDRKVDPTLFKAADLVKDGELVATPVKEGSKWAVIWKRQTNRAVTKSIDAEAPGIRAALADERIRDAVQKLLSDLRAQFVKEENPELVDMVVVSATGDLEKAKRPGTLPRTKHAAHAAPTEAPGGLR